MVNSRQWVVQVATNRTFLYLSTSQCLIWRHPLSPQCVILAIRCKVRGWGVGHEDNGDSFIWRAVNPETGLLTQIPPLFSRRSQRRLLQKIRIRTSNHLAATGSSAIQHVSKDFAIWSTFSQDHRFIWEKTRQELQLLYQRCFHVHWIHTDVSLWCFKSPIFIKKTCQVKVSM